MNRNLGLFFLNISVALYLFVNGILGFYRGKSELTEIIRILFGEGNFSSGLVLLFSLCAYITGLFLVLELFQIELPFTGFLLLIFLGVWGVYIIFSDIINPIITGYSFFNQGNLLLYLRTLSTHLMICGGLLMAIKRFN
ncbi:MAG: hypothetical protein LBP43_00095 [Treponema sp.]|nr:hypothetical protein [Treponema sp.]